MQKETKTDEKLNLELYKKELEVSAYKREAEDLKKDIEKLNKSHKHEIDKLNFEIEAKDQMLDNAKTLLKIMQKAIFASKSEKVETLDINIDDLFLFNEDELEQKEEPTCEDVDNKEREVKKSDKKHPSYEDGAKKRAAYKKQDLTTLAKETAFITEDHTNEVEVPIDSVTGKQMVQVGVKREYKVAKVVKYVVIEHLFPIFAPTLDFIEDNGAKGNVTVYPQDNRVLNGCMIEDTIVAEICTDKYLFGMPLERMAEKHRQSGVMISKQNMVHWLDRLAKYAEPLIDLFKEKLLSSPLINMDETPHRVLTDEGGLKNSVGRYEIVQVGTGDGYQVVVYSFNTGRSAATLATFLKEYKGALMTDGLSGYSVIDKKNLEHTKFLKLACWAHCRRNFYNIVLENKKSPCALILKHIGKLYTIEETLRNDWKDGKFDSKEAFNAERIKQTAPIFNAIKGWLTTNSKRYKEGTSELKAIKYALNRWEELISYPNIFEATPDNNLAERFTRPFSMGEKAWYFSDTIKGAKTSSIIYTLAQNAALANINVYDYFWTLLKKLPECIRTNTLETLLPWNVDLTDAVNYKKILSEATPNAERTEDYVLRGGLY